MKLDFVWPECVSSSTSEGDFIVVTFNDQRLFKDKEGSPIWPQFEVKARIKRQEAITTPQKNVLYGFDLFCQWFILVTSTLTILMSLFMRRLGGLKRLTTAFKNVQLVLFTLLIRVQLAAHTEEFMGSLKRVLTFEYVDTTTFATYAFGSPRTEPLDVHFELMGFETSDTILNLSSVLGLLTCICIVVNLVYLLR